jgi:hypothetical protein
LSQIYGLGKSNMFWAKVICSWAKTICSGQKQYVLGKSNMFLGKNNMFWERKCHYCHLAPYMKKAFAVDIYCIAHGRKIAFGGFLEVRFRAKYFLGIFVPSIVYPWM